MLIMFLATSPMLTFAETTGTNASDSEQQIRMIFPDTVTNWSQKFVAKLAALGVVKGKDDGTYGTLDPISQQEVIIMAVRLIGAEEEANKLSNVGTALETANWARPHVLYALSNGILDPVEEMANGGATNWGSRFAKREWVAKVIIRALGKDADARAAANVPTTFRDNQDISPDMIGYVNAAVKLGIITGTPNNDFLPLSTITRSEIAAVYARAEQYLPERDLAIHGYVTSLTSDAISIRDANGDVHRLSLSNQTAYYRHDGNYQVLRSEVKVGQEVYVVAPDGAAIYVEVLNDEVPFDTIVGELVDVDTHSRLIKMIVDDKRVDYLLDESVGVIDLDGSGSSLSQLVPLSTVELKKNSISNRIVEIHVKDKPLSKDSEGTIVRVDMDEISIYDHDSETVETYPISTQILATQDDKILMLTDLKPADEIEYRVVHGFVTEINVVNPYVEPIRGTVHDVDVGKMTIVIRNQENVLEAYEIADNVQVYLEGLAAPALSDVYDDDTVILTVDANNVVTDIRVENRTIKYLHMVEYVTFREKSNKIVISNTSGSYESLDILDLTENTVLEVFGIEYPIEELDKHIKKEQRIDLVLTGKYVQQIKLANSYTGKLKDYNLTTRKIVITNPDIGDITLNLGFPYFIMIRNQPVVSLEDLKIGEEVRVILGMDQQTVQQIQVKRNDRFTIESVNIGARRLTLRDTSNKLHYLTISNSVTIEHPEKSYVTINELKAGQTITVTYYGTNAASVNIVNEHYGIVEHIDRINRKLSVITLDEQIITVDTGERFHLYNKNEEVAVSTLLPGDRLSFIVDKDGYVFANIVARQSKIFYRLESGQQIAFTNPLNEVERVKLADNVIVRAGDRTIGLNELRANDNLYIYIVNDEIVEIEKR